MPDNYISATGIAEHSDRNLTGKGTLILPMNVLGRDRHAGAFGLVDGGAQCGEGRSDDNVAVLDIPD